VSLIWQEKDGLDKEGEEEEEEEEDAHPARRRHRLIRSR
jgi:hypothetical protein